MCRDCQRCDVCRTATAPDDCGWVTLLAVVVLAVLGMIASGMLAWLLGG